MKLLKYMLPVAASVFLAGCGGGGSSSSAGPAVSSASVLDSSAASSSSSTASSLSSSVSSSSLSSSSSSLVSSSSSSAVSSVVAANNYGRIASYTFESTLEDSLKLNKAGTATGNRIGNTGGTALYAAGMTGNALQMDGTYGVRLPDNFIKSYKYTVSLWLKPAELTQYITAFFGAASDTSWVNLAPASWNLNTMLWSGNAVWYDADTGSKIPLNTWTHMAFAVDNGAVSVFVNGNLAFTGVNFPNVFTASTNVFALGVNYWDTPYKGLIDELRLYDRALSAGEVAALDIDNAAVSELPVRAKTLLDLGNISAVTGDLVLPSVGAFGAAVTWVSSNTAVISTQGKVIRPAIGAADAMVTLTATLVLDGVTQTKHFTVTVSALTLAVTFNPISLEKVKITSGPFKHAEDTNLQYLLKMDTERLLAPYRREAGITTAATNYPSWESEGLDGHIGGHYLSALSLMYASTGNAQVLERLNYMIDALDAVQKAQGDGYIGGIPGGKAQWAKIAAGTITNDAFTLNTMWVPWYNLHKLYAGLRDAYTYSGNAKAKTMLIALSNWAIKTTENLTDAQIQAMLKTEHGGMNEIFADVAALTNEAKYLTSARRFSDKSILQPLLSNVDQLTGTHANTQIPKVIGYARIGKLGNDSTWMAAADYFWQQVVNKRSVSIGGNSVAEHFNPSNDFSSMINRAEGPETCNTYNMLKLTKALYQQKGDVSYIDYYERALYNHILSSQHPDHGGLVYFTPMRPDHYRVYSAVDKGMWCCVGSGIENHAKYGEMIYADYDDQFYVNLFVDSTVDWKDGIKITQATSFPDAETTKLTISKAATFDLNIRYPKWVEAGKASVLVNNEAVALSAKPGEYIKLQRAWKAGDQVQVTLPMRTTAEQLPDGTKYYSLVHGPIVLAAKDDPFPGENLSFVGGSARMDHIANGKQCPLNIAPIFISESTEFLSKIVPVVGEPLTFTTGAAVLNKSVAMTLIPFFRLHDSRYSVYFGQSTASNWAILEAELKAQAAAEAALAAITLDQVSPGEQQPESDHGLLYSNSGSGIHLGRYWRDATGWFSYALHPKSKTKLKLRVTYFGNDSGRSFKIYINEQLLSSVSLTGGMGDVFIDKDYIITDGLITDPSKTFRVKFVADTNSVAGGVFGVRLLNNE